MAKLGSTQIFGTITLVDGTTIDIDGLQIGGSGATVSVINTTFVDNDTSLMTSQAIKEKITSYNYSTTVGTVTSVSGSDPISVDSGSPTPTVSHASTDGNLHIPSGGNTGQFVKYGGTAGNGTWDTPAYNTFAGSDAITAVQGEATLVLGGILKITGDTKTAANFYAGTGNPDGATRLNYDGNFWATAVYGAVYNDYGDYWQTHEDEPIEYGKVYIVDDGKLRLCRKRADKRTYGISTNTAAFHAGISNGNIEISIGGVILAHVDKIYKSGTMLVSNKHGVLTKARFWERSIAMFIRKEEKEIWNKVEVKGRNWVKIR